MTDLQRLDPASLKGVLESLLLVSSDAVSASEFARILDVGPGEVSSALADLAAEYADADRGFQLREVAGGWRLYTLSLIHI